MAYLNTNEAHHDLKIGVLDGIKSNFPIEGKKQSIHLEGLDVRDGVMDPEDVAEQHTAKVEGKSWAAPVYAKLKMVNNDTGMTVDTKEMKLAEVPRMTKRYSYIVDGNELQVDNQWQLKPGVYARRRRNGKLETRFNLANKASFHVTLDPEKKQFLMERGKSKGIPVYPLMKEMGIDDDTLEKKWGKEVFAANKTGKNVATALERFYKADKKRAPKDTTEAREYFHQVMRDSKLRPEATELTLGKGFKQVEGDTFTRATKKMIDVLGGAPEDERDSLAFKELRTTADYAKDKLTEWRTQKTIRQKAARKINHATNIREVIKSDTFGDAVKSTFTKNALARTADQVNPVEMISSSFQTTVMGPGGIQSEQSINDETKLINSSHLGFLDPIHTPEGSKTGVSLHLPLGVKKVGNTPTVPVYNLKTGKPERIDPTTFHKSKVVMPDQVKWKDGRPVPVSESVQISGRGNEVVEDKFKNADYTMQDSSQLFSMTSNLIPWLGSNSGNRASYADSQISQAISLKHREAPLVQVGTRSDLKGGLDTFEGFMGKQSAHSSPVDGQVVAVSKNAVTIKGGDGKKRKVGLYNNFPLNDPKAVLDSTARVKKGDAVKKGQVVADNNFTENGKLALGTNLQAAYIPLKGLNFEDGVAISESAAKKMTSVHMHKPDIQLADTAVTDPKQYRIHHPEAFTKDQYERVDERGIAKVGQRVMPGDPLVLATRPYELKGRMGIRSVRKSLSTQQSDNALRWKSDHPGEVVGVHKDKKGNITVHVKTEEPMQIGDKVSGRHGNKGIVTSIIPDNEMPVMPNGKSIDIALNPSGVPGRMNMGQVFETVAGKIAQKTGKPYVVKNFEYGVDQLEKIQSELKKHGLSDTEELKDPKSGQSLGKALVGPQHMLKLNFQIDKKISARAGNPLEGSEPEYYDPSTLIPSGGGKTGGQSIGNLDLYALLAHGAKANIREMQTWKSEGPDTRGEGSRWDSQHNEVWRNIQNGDPIPPPKKTFAFQKFEDMLRASGVNVEKKGHRIQISPLLDTQVLKMSAGELKDPSALTYSKLDKNGEPVPRPGGLFDTRMTGGHGGKKWTHMKLAEPMPNPVFEPAVMKVLGMPKKDYHAVVQGDKAVKNGKLVPLETPGSKAGGAAIVDMLGKVDVDKELKKSETALNQLKLPENLAHRKNTPKLDTAMKKVRYLRTLKKLGMSPKEAYSINNLPIIPPAMRPASVLPDGNVHWADLNGLYSQMGQINGKMKDPILRKYMGDKDLKDKRAEMYDGLKALVGVGGTYADRQGDDKGVLLQLHGKEPKKGFFQGTLLKRRQDMSMRSTITPDPGMGIDNVGLPEEKALTLFRPFVTKKMVDLGAARDPLAAQDMLAKKKKDKMVYKALDAVMQERPVILKRDPVLHKHSVQAFNAHRVPGRAIQIHPLVTGGYNADFDGDTMSAFVPVSKEAVEEAKGMMPSSNLYNAGSGDVAYTPTLESNLGLYKMSMVTGDGKKRFKNPTDVLKSARDGKTKVTDLVSVGGKKTTAGRIMLASAVPEGMQNQMLYDTKLRLDKEGIKRTYTQLAKDHRSDFGESASSLMKLGYDASYGSIKVRNPETKGTAFSIEKEAEDPKKNVQFLPMGTHSFSLDDFKTDKKTRDPLVAQARKKVAQINSVPGLSSKERLRRSTDVWFDASEKMKKVHTAKMERNPNNLYMMHQAGVKPGWDQYQQLKLAPMLLVDAKNKVIPTPVTKSYSEGLDVGSYWTQQSGARRGVVQKVQEVAGPGAFTKQLMNTSMGLVVNEDDCGTRRGITLKANSNDIYDRELSKDMTVKGKTFKAGTIMTPDVVGHLRAADKKMTVPVRSALKCEHGKGICQKCAGLAPDGSYFKKGTNVGVLATQSLGERSTQLAMKAFHSGGIAKRHGGTVRVADSFKRVLNLTELPKDVPNAARLSMKSGKVEKLERDPLGVNVWVGGQKHHVPKDPFGNPLHQPMVGAATPGWKPPKIGMKVEAGQPLSDPTRTFVNPHDLYKATGNMEVVQNHLVNELHGIYGNEGVRRQHTELVVKGMSDLTRVTNPGDADHLVRGEYQSASQMRAMNKGLASGGRKPVQHTPILKGIPITPLEVQEDWMAKLNHRKLRQTIAEGAMTGASSHLHGEHPVPGMAYGAEFGMTEKHKFQKPHLKDVPKWAY